MLNISNYTSIMADLSFIRDTHTRSMVSNGHQAITQLELWSWMKTFEPENGFMFSTDPNVILIGETMNTLPNPPGHSGSSFGITMRHLQFIAKNGLEKYKEELTKNR